MIEFKLDTTMPAGGDSGPAVSIIGIGGAGSNVLDHIALEGMDGVELVSMNCDARSLTTSMAQRKVQLGKSLTQGLGCGGDPELGHEAAAGSLEEIREAISGRRMIFVCVGLGGGTGSGAGPVITRLARESGAFVIVFATLPFVFEGKRRMQQAQAALDEIRQHANALVCFENDKMGELVLPKKGVTEAFEVADRIICQSVRAVTTVATQPGLIRIGMDDLVTALRNADSRCLFGFGQAKGEARASEALQAALKSPLLDRGQLLEKARNVLVHICGGQSLTLFEIESLMRDLSKHVSEEAQILFGAACDSKLGDALSVTIISSIGKQRPAAAPVAVQSHTQPVAPVRPAPVQTAAFLTPVTQTVPVLSVQPRQAPPPSSLLAPVPVTVTTATSAVPVLKLNAQVLPPVKPVKPVRSAPMAPPAAEPDLFSAPVADDAPAASEAALSPELEIEEPVAQEAEAAAVEAMAAELEEAAAPAMPTVEAPEPVEAALDEIEAYEEPAVMRLVEEEPQAAVAEETVDMDECEPVVQAVQHQPEEEVYEEEVVAEVMEEIVAEEIAEEPEAVPQHPAYQTGSPRAASPIRPIEPTPPAAPVQPARKFDLREILQRQRQTRLGQISRPPLPPAPEPAPVAETPSRPVTPARPSPRTDRTPDPERLSPIRPIPAARAASPFIPTRPPAAQTPQQAPRPVHAHAQQATFDERLAPAVRAGRFEKAEPTVEEGEDLDVPTFLRKKR